MIGTGTIINSAAVVIGGLIGLKIKGGLKPRFHDTLMQALGLSVIFIGISGAMEGILKITNEGLSAKGTMGMVVALVIGALLGEWINLEAQTERFGEWLKKKAKSDHDSMFVESFVSASFTICIGAMAIVGSLEDGLSGDATMLITKAMLDFVVILIFSSTFGKGPIFSVIPLAFLQGGVTLIAKAIEPVLSTQTISNISFIGSTLIFCIGINLMFQTKIKVANLLPSLLIVFLYGIIHQMIH
ncbi:MAG: DUF554 domain-containing protein [Clostridia bacterium]|nr:DUF554 domain-containing protein [Clostridia bacterium]